MKSCLPKAASAATTGIKKLMDTALDQMPISMQGDGEGRVLLAMMYFRALDRIPSPRTLLSSHKSRMGTNTSDERNHKSWTFLPISFNIRAGFSGPYRRSPTFSLNRNEEDWERDLETSVDSAMARTKIAASSALSQADRVEVWKAECRGYIMGRRDGRLDEIFNTIQ